MTTQEQTFTDGMARARVAELGRAAIPERPCHLAWLHGETVPEISPRQAAERTARLKPAGRLWD